MSRPDIFTDPSFAGLHWSIPRDTPPEEREREHYLAAITARALARPKPRQAHVHTSFNPLTCTYPCCGVTVFEEANRG